ncbi:MAG: hypothetical protein WBB85_02605 [Albidovulum sp.]|uniref:hypothetical protein n=1 Tax=Albidovulum sp. TaxID=1872424 RepID=UPI003CA88C0A
MVEQQNENPGALAGATGAEIETASFKTASYRLRAEWANALVFCLGEVHADDAAQICAAYLDRLRTSGPAHPFLNEVREEAEYWAYCAHVPELEAVVLAGLRRLGEMALGIGCRKRLFVKLWDSFSDADRLSFARRVGVIGGGI